MSNGFKSPYQLITDRILADLEQGVAAWVKPWKSEGAVVPSRPMNFSNATVYRGVNTIMLHVACIERGWPVPAFATFNQVRKMKGVITKGSKGCHVFFKSQVESDPKSPEEESRAGADGKIKRTVLKGYTVFNISQVDGIDLDIPGMSKPSELPSDVLELTQLVGVKLSHGGDRAFYAMDTDQITLPVPDVFESIEHYKATAFHEVGHATGHESRLNRQFGRKFGDDAYAFEELVAELSAAFLAMEFGVQGNLRHPEYIASWIRILKGDMRAFYGAAAEAQRAMDWIRERAAIP
ncbi:ArdC family protein [Agrobacterium radiobacter]|uniref:ArdC family protein n=1 Tax=Agrobacterium radiobacter TaxID=362 RepID=UPI003CE4BCEE